MSTRQRLWIAVPLTYLVVRLVSRRVITGAWNVDAELVALLVIVPLAQVMALDLVRRVGARRRS